MVYHTLYDFIVLVNHLGHLEENYVNSCQTSLNSSGYTLGRIWWMISSGPRKVLLMQVSISEESFETEQQDPTQYYSAFQLKDEPKQTGRQWHYLWYNANCDSQTMTKSVTEEYTSPLLLATKLNKNSLSKGSVFSNE